MKLLLNISGGAIVSGGNIFLEENGKKKLRCIFDTKDNMYRIDAAHAPGVKHSIKFLPEEMKAIADAYNANIKSK